MRGVKDDFNICGFITGRMDLPSSEGEVTADSGTGVDILRLRGLFFIQVELVRKQLDM